jgi:phosphoribosylaminoimidazole-succinocarboxamide synthase
MQAAKRDNLQLIYQGSVKRVFGAPQQDDRLWFEFSDDYSVFDWGKMPDTIANKGRALSIMGAHFFSRLGQRSFWRELESSPALASLDRTWLNQLLAGSTYKRLCQTGVDHHFHRLCNAQGVMLDMPRAAVAEGAVYMEVDRATVARPKQCSVLGQIIYEYPNDASRIPVRLIPLEVVFRFGMPAGSSLKERLERNPNYARELGLAQTPASNEFFPHPVLEFYTKLEPKDRLLTMSEALNISTLKADEFAELAELSLLLALALKHIFGSSGIELWDGKFEFIFRNGKICLADSIGPDELRLIYAGIQLSKETIRQVYRGTPWEKSLKEAQNIAAERGSAEWKRICRDELKSVPDRLPAEFKDKIDHLYGVLTNHVVGEELFPDQPTLDAFARSFSVEKK